MTAERYTAVFTGAFVEKKPGEYLYLTMSENPLAPDGHSMSQGRPSYKLFGSEIAFQDFPEGCQRLVLRRYRRLWNLPGG